jgi:hypothetical protein
VKEYYSKCLCIGIYYHILDGVRPVGLITVGRER